MIFSLLFACAHSSSPPATPETPEAPPKETSPGNVRTDMPAPGAHDKALLASLLAKGACQGDAEAMGDLPSLKRYATPDGRELLEITCAFFAYQGMYDYWLGPDEAPTHTSILALGIPAFDEQTGTLNWLEKFRGPSDCGIAHTAQLTETDLVTTAERRRECDVPGDILPPEEWTLTGPASQLEGTLTDLQNGDHACYAVLTSASGEQISWPGGFDLCFDNPLVGKEVRLVMERADMNAQSCQGDPECKDQVTVDFVQDIVAKTP
jgi:hypothetical protein